MVTVSMKSGPLAGREYHGLWELLDAQAELRASCKHESVKVETGFCGQYSTWPRYWRRTRCARCGSVRSNMSVKIGRISEFLEFCDAETFMELTTKS